MRKHLKNNLAFTLIEMSIVLVIIGLIVGGILVGQSLIKAAEVRATVTQVDKYQTATNTFRDKFDALPGDIPAAPAAQFGFAARGSLPGQGDGNGILQGSTGGSTGVNVSYLEGELVMFWVDLSAAHLIDQTFTTGTSASNTCLAAAISSCFPSAKLGYGNYIYVFSDGNFSTTWTTTGLNYFGMSTFSGVQANGAIANSTPALTVQQAYAIDAKIDDGLPQSGNVLAEYENSSLSSYASTWAAGGGVEGAHSTTAPYVGPTTAATPGSLTTCYDNSSSANGSPGVAGAAQHYSVEINNGSNVNCALSFRFQ